MPPAATLKQDQKNLEDMSLEEWDSPVLTIDILETHLRVHQEALPEAANG